MENTLKSSCRYIHSIQASISALAVSWAFALSPLSAEVSTNRLAPVSSVVKSNPAASTASRDESRSMDSLIAVLGDLHEGLDSDYKYVQECSGKLDSASILIFQELADALTGFVDEFKPAAKKGLLAGERLSVFNEIVDARMKSLRLVNTLRQRTIKPNVFESPIDLAGLMALSQQVRKVEARSV